MGSDFLPGMVIGALLGVLTTMIGLSIFARLNTSKRKIKKRDPADWWKRGEPPPY